MCEHALWSLDDAGGVPATWPTSRVTEAAGGDEVGSGADGRAAVEKALELFFRQRAGLRPLVKLTASWSSPVASSSYFYFFACYHALRALEELGGPQAARRRAELRRDVLAVNLPLVERLPWASAYVHELAGSS